MNEQLQTTKSNFGTTPVFLTAISTILGAIMFLRFGFSVGSVGFAGSLIIILIGHAVTIPTALALGEIATNQKVEGGGEYFIISRSFGLNIGAAIGIALFLSQAISVAFYTIAFAESFNTIKPWLSEHFHIEVLDNRLFSIPALAGLILLMVTRGADLGIKALYIVVSLLIVSLIFFFLGDTSFSHTPESSKFLSLPTADQGFFYVFSIIFPAFTGMTAGVGLSGDLRDPKKSIPLGTLAATITGMIIYILIAYKLFVSASPADLLSDQLIMSKIAIWGPIIPIGLAAATISSAIGSFMVAPRTLQAIGADDVMPNKAINKWLATGTQNRNEPRNATIATSIIALVFVLIGDVNAVAVIISMFFLVTYGSLCLISFLQHFAADPAYRPSFKSKWYISLFGALMCIYLMFKINPAYALLSVILMVSIYFYITYNNPNATSMARIFEGVIHQFSRRVQVFLQKSEKENAVGNWRPGVICLSKDSFQRFAAFEMMKWISHRYGFGTYIHFENKYFSKESKQLADADLEKLIDMAEKAKSNVFLETIITPSNTSAILQAIQQPAVSGQPNNMMLFEFAKGDREWLTQVIENYNLLLAAKYDIVILRSSIRNFGYKRNIHVWIRKEDYENASLMILLSYIILGHKDWSQGEIKIFAIFSEKDLETEKQHLIDLTTSGRLPISPSNIKVISQYDGMNHQDTINEYSADADLTLVGFHESVIKAKGEEFFERYDKVGDILFVNTQTSKFIT